MIHMLKAWPSILARKSLHARERVIIPAFERYFAEDGLLTASTLTKCRYNHNTGHGLRGRDVAATEVGQLVASLTNSMASAFWMVYHVFSDPVVLNECREEIEQLVRVDDDGVSVIDLSKLKSSCPILLSTWQETLRYVHIGVTARIVMEDVMLSNKYLLKKGATVMVVAPVQHTDESNWGLTVNQFDHRRFLSSSGKKPKNRAAFRSFGGGTVLCPGRHFVSMEVMALAALLLLRFELKPVRDGRWMDPGKVLPMTTAIPTPKDNVAVKFIPRDNRKWRVEFSASGKGVNMVAEDEAGH
jgi:cytochrome P450